MRLFKLQLGRLAIEYDRDYGFLRRKGWTVKYGGIVCRQFASDPLTALWESRKTIRECRAYLRNPE